MQLNRYEMLTKLHELIRPRAYLEIGVQTGASLQLALGADKVVGVDPDYSLLTYDVNRDHVHLVETTSDAFFAAEPSFVDPETGESTLDLVFIDGMHRVENVGRDLFNAAGLSHLNTVLVLDDVLPRNNVEAGRDMIPGDWTGDVYKIIRVLRQADYRAQFWLVDTFPTGMLIALKKRIIFQDAGFGGRIPILAEEAAAQPIDVPQSILDRTKVTPYETVLDRIKEALDV